MRTSLRAAAVIAVGLTGITAAATDATACRFSGASGVKGAIVNSSLSVQNGKACFFRNFTNVSDAVGNRRYPTTNIRITSRPSRGSASIEGNRITYKAPPGGAGSDQFTYQTIMKSGTVYDHRVLVTIY